MLKASQIEKKIDYLEKKKTDADSANEDQKELLKNKLILKTQQRFKIEGRHVFTEENNIIALSSNDDKK